MFRILNLGLPPPIFLDLKDDVPLCASCIFGTARIRNWITKENKSGSTMKEIYNKPGAAVSVDQLQ